MCPVPRVAIGSVFPRTAPSLVPWALMQVLQEEGHQVQAFLSKTVFPQHLAVAAITGRPQRYLDSWVMDCRQCIHWLLQMPESTAVAVVEGAFPGGFNGAAQGGRLDTLCRWLHLPRVGLIDVRRVELSRLSQLLEELDGCLLENVRDSQQFHSWQTAVERQYRIPILGAMEPAAKLWRSLNRLPPGEKPSRAWCHLLGQRFRRWWQPERFWQVACSRPLPQYEVFPPAVPVPARSTVVAVAYDEAFSCYFPELLETIESQGATVATFSPLRDEGLPAGTTMVYIGCGHAEYYAAQLARNHCMHATLRHFAAAGKPIYAEGAGAAYLCEQMDDQHCRAHRSVAVFAAAGRWRPGVSNHQPQEVTITHSGWLFPAGTRLRGYRHPAWQIEPTGMLTDLTGHDARRLDLFGTKQVVGSMIHLYLVAWPELTVRLLRASH